MIFFFKSLEENVTSRRNLIFTLLLLFMSGDIELNPGPNKTNYSCKFSVCHWNLNSLAAHNFGKVGLYEAYNTNDKFDIICVSGSYLDSKISSDSKYINIKSFKLVGANHPNNTKTVVLVGILDNLYQFA